MPLSTCSVHQHSHHVRTLQNPAKVKGMGTTATLLSLLSDEGVMLGGPDVGRGTSYLHVQQMWTISCRVGEGVLLNPQARIRTNVAAQTGLEECSNAAWRRACTAGL